MRKHWLGFLVLGFLIASGVFRMLGDKLAADTATGWFLFLLTAYALAALKGRSQGRKG
jgi:hypothetical protein